MTLKSYSVYSVIIEKFNSKKNFYVYVFLDQRKPGKYTYFDDKLQIELNFDFEPFYIGKGSGNRNVVHLKKCNLKIPSHKNNKIKSIQNFGFEPKIFNIFSNIFEDKAFLLETILINTIGREDLKQGPLTNKTDGGEGTSGFVPNINDSLLKNFPELAKEWDYKLNGILTPDIVSKCAGIKIWWLTKKNNEINCDCKYLATVHSRTFHLTGSPFLDGKLVCKHNCLATLSPDIASDFHPTKNGNLTTYNILNGGNKKMWWKCHKCEYEWRANISDRVGYNKNRSKCPNCSKRSRWTEEQYQYIKELYLDKGLGCKEIYNIWISDDGKFNKIKRTKESIKIKLERLKLKHTFEQTYNIKSRNMTGNNNPMSKNYKII